MRLGVEAALVERELVPGDIEVVDGVVDRIGLPSANGRGIAAPGFVDLQVNGFAGVDLLGADADGYRRVGEALLETGVTAYLPTFITAAEEELVNALHVVGQELRQDARLEPGVLVEPIAAGPRILGAHLEGPFIAPSRLGAHPRARRRDPDIDLLARLLAAGPVRLVTLAPELPGAGSLIATLLERGVAVSCGHTDATAAQADAAFDQGARTVTHLFNAMRPLHHREPGIAGAALLRDDIVVQVIVDGVHLAPDTVRLVWRAAAGRVALVTDAMAGAALGDGRYGLGDVEVEIKDGVARGPEGQLAGSVLTMLEAVRNLHALGVPLADALDAATTVPARVLGEPLLGRLAPGAAADVVVLSDELELERVLVGGEERVVC